MTTCHAVSFHRAQSQGLPKPNFSAFLLSLRNLRWDSAAPQRCCLAAGSIKNCAHRGVPCLDDNGGKSCCFHLFRNESVELVARYATVFSQGEQQTASICTEYCTCVHSMEYSRYSFRRSLAVILAKTQS